MRSRIGSLAIALLGLLGVLLAGAPAGRAQDGVPLHVVSYTVRSGDTTSAIAEYFYGRQTETEPIAAYNRLANVNRISVGQTLEIPFYDAETWRAYAERTGLPPDLPPNAAVGGGAEDVAVPLSGHAHSLSGRWLVIGGYGAVAVVLTTILYLRSRRHEHTALGVGTSRR